MDDVLKNALGKEGVGPIAFHLVFRDVAWTICMFIFVEQCIHGIFQAGILTLSKLVIYK